MEVRVRAVCWVLCWVQDTIEALLRVPDVMKSLSDVLRKVKDASRLLTRLQVSHIAPFRPAVIHRKRLANGELWSAETCPQYAIMTSPASVSIVLHA